MPKANIRTRLLRACYSFMVPVARFLLRSGISFTEFSDVARMAFVDVAGQDFGLRGRPTNISRVSAMTGIGRKEVRALRRRTARYNGAAIEHGPLAQVLHRWYTDRKYLDTSGNPKPLSTRGARSSFTQLVRSCAGDIPVGAVRVELLRAGSILEDASGRVRPIRRHMIPADLDEKLLTSLCFSLRGLASTIAFNTAANDLGEAGRIERFCWADGLSEKNIERLRPALREEVRTFSEKIDDLLGSRAAKTDGPSRRIGVGIYYFEEEASAVHT